MRNRHVPCPGLVPALRVDRDREHLLCAARPGCGPGRRRSSRRPLPLRRAQPCNGAPGVAGVSSCRSEGRNVARSRAATIGLRAQAVAPVRFQLTTRSTHREDSPPWPPNLAPPSSPAPRRHRRGHRARDGHPRLEARHRRPPGGSSGGDRGEGPGARRGGGLRGRPRRDRRRLRGAFLRSERKRPRCCGRDREQRRSVALPLALGYRYPLAPQRDRDESDRPDGSDSPGPRPAARRGNGRGRGDVEQRRCASPATGPAGLRRLEGGPRELRGGAESGARGHRHPRRQAAARPGAERVRHGLGYDARGHAEADGALGLLRPARRAHACPGQPGHPHARRRGACGRQRRDAAAPRACRHDRAPAFRSAPS